MQFVPTSLDGVVLIGTERVHDERGYFVRTGCRHAFATNGLTTEYAQSAQSYTTRRGTLRGLHYQCPPHQEAKLVMCARGAIYDVVVDIRPSSPTYLDWASFELTSDNGKMLYIPEGFAHGFQTLCDDVDVTYRLSHPYTPAAARGLRHDDPTLCINWPEKVSLISVRDANWPLLFCLQKSAGIANGTQISKID